MKMKYTPQKYSWFELMFSKYRWGRKLSGGYWVLLNEQGYSWVKFKKEEFEAMAFQPGTTFQIEDYMKPPLQHDRFLG
jgi:hypothetical protein